MYKAKVDSVRRTFPEDAKKPLRKSGFLHHHKVTKWRRHPDSNWRVKLLQSFALPLGHGADMER